MWLIDCSSRLRRGQSSSGESRVQSSCSGAAPRGSPCTNPDPVPRVRLGGPILDSPIMARHIMARVLRERLVVAAARSRCAGPFAARAGRAPPASPSTLHTTFHTRLHGTPGSWGQSGADGGRTAGGAAGGRIGAGRRVILARMASCRVWAKANRRGPFWTAAVVFKKERVKGFEPPFEAGTSTLVRGGVGVGSREAGAACARRGFALHRALHGLAAAAGTRGQSFVGSDDAGELICRANFVGTRPCARARSSRLGER